jgi:peroxiredoxin
VCRDIVAVVVVMCDAREIGVAANRFSLIIEDTVGAKMAESEHDSSHTSSRRSVELIN